MIKRMKAMGGDKETGISWIEIENKTHSFVVEDKLHPQAEAIYDVLSELFPVMVYEGFRSEKRHFLHYTEEGKNQEYINQESRDSMGSVRFDFGS